MKYIKIKLKSGYRDLQPAFNGIFILLTENVIQETVLVQPATYSHAFDGYCPNVVLSLDFHAEITEVIND
jgi:hypothetical protein